MKYNNQLFQLQFAELCLAQELLIYKESFNYLYLLSVHHYGQGRFDDCLSHLKKASQINCQVRYLNKIIR